MRFNCGPSRVEKKKQEREQWHEWFALYPVNIGGGQCAWLEAVQRKQEIGSIYGSVLSTSYRAAL